MVLNSTFKWGGPPCNKRPSSRLKNCASEKRVRDEVQKFPRNLVKEVTNGKGVDLILDPILASNFDYVIHHFSLLFLEYELSWYGFEMGPLWNYGRIKGKIGGKLHKALSKQGINNRNYTEEPLRCLQSRSLQTF